MPIKIVEAKQILFTHACGGKVPSKDKLQEAEMLGAETMKLLDSLRHEYQFKRIFDLLPGEEDWR